MDLSIPARRDAAYWVALLAVSVTLLGLARPGAAQPRPLGAASPADLRAGEEIFNGQCAVCHGAGGTGGTGPDLRRVLLHYAKDDQELVAVIREGIPGTSMPFNILTLTDTMIWQTAAYVRSLGRAAPEPVKGNARRGADLYEANGCRTCHTIGGRGGVLGPDLTVIGVQRGAASLRQSLIDPGAEHAPSYRVVNAVLKTGSEIRGIRVDEDVFWVHIREASGEIRTLSKANILRLERQPTGTLMPSYQGLPQTDLDDLVAYLSTQREKQ